MSNNFDKYYDLIFLNKNYKKEVLYILKKIKKIRVSKILDVGCGTGTHINLISKKKKSFIYGLDDNKNLIKQAKKKNPTIIFKTSKVKDIKENNFDLVLSMFNIVNYFKDFKKLVFFFSDIKKKMSKESILIFDAWNGSFKFKSKNAREKRIIKNKNFILTNNIESINKPITKNILLKYKIIINFFKDKKNIYINHRLVQFLWTPNQIKSALVLAGFKNIIIKKSFSDKSFTKHDLKIIFLAK